MIMSEHDSDGSRTAWAARRIGDLDIVLEARPRRVAWPFGGLVWNRPVGVRVRGLQGDQRLPIHDVTRRLQLAAYGLSLLFIGIGLSWRGRSRKE